MLINTSKVIIKFLDEKIELADVDGGTFGYDRHQNVLSDLNLLDEVLVIHHCYLEVAAAAQLSELVLEIRVKDVDAASQSCQEIIIDLSFEFKVLAEPAVNFTVIFKFCKHDRLQIRHPAHELHRLLLQVC